MPRSITPARLAARIAADDVPCIVDVRRTPAYATAGDALPQAIRRPPETVGAWSRDLAPGRPVVVYCVHGHEVGQQAASTLADLGFDAAYLEGGIEAWRAEGRPVAAKPARSTLWVTRERPKIDRIACPWLVRRFVDSEARFLYVPAARVAAVASETGAVPYDVPDVAFSHEDERCSFDAFVRHYGLGGPAMDRLALVVRGADTSRFDLAPPAAGLFAVSLGLSALYPDDHAMLEQGMVVYDALYTWCGQLQGEAHDWPPQMAA
ncbi:MAG: chromate resistance protein [Alphaproteobacteria bacterium]|nr:chromate resistance protein [Alphaproteobacteria bacterium]